jgi:hypothetical protein
MPYKNDFTEHNPLHWTANTNVYYIMSLKQIRALCDSLKSCSSFEDAFKKYEFINNLFQDNQIAIVNTNVKSLPLNGFQAKEIFPEVVDRCLNIINNFWGKK